MFDRIEEEYSHLSFRGSPKRRLNRASRSRGATDRLPAYPTVWGPRSQFAVEASFCRGCFVSASGGRSSVVIGAIANIGRRYLAGLRMREQEVSSARWFYDEPRHRSLKSKLGISPDGADRRRLRSGPNRLAESSGRPPISTSGQACTDVWYCLGLKSLGTEDSRRLHSNPLP